MVSGLGEFSFCFWLLIKGVKASQWHEMAKIQQQHKQETI
jgi:hypothetical protein